MDLFSDQVRMKEEVLKFIHPAMTLEQVQQIMEAKQFRCTCDRSDDSISLHCAAEQYCGHFVTHKVGVRIDFDATDKVGNITIERNALTGL